MAAAIGIASPAAFAVDSIRGQEWHLDAMHASDVWQTSTGTGVTVAVIDDGVKADHPDLEGQLLPGMDFSGQSGGVTTPRDGHGTAMVSIIVGTGRGLNGQGAYGLAPGAKVLPIKINSAAGLAGGVNGSEYLKQIDRSIVYAADHGAKIISLSQGIGTGFITDADAKALKTAVDYANSHGSLIFAAAGNSGNVDNHVEYPAAIPGVVGVAAIDQDGKSTAESEHGPQVVLAAPGQDIYAACTSESGYCKGHGTSDATAVTSASAALIWSAHRDWTNNQVLRVLINTAGKPQDGSGRSDFVGYGVVRPRIALTTPGDPGPADVSPLAGAAAAAAVPTGSASAPVASAPAAGGGVPATGGVVSAPAKKSGSVGLIVGGAAVGLLVLVVVIVLVARNSRKGSMPPPVPGGYLGPQSPQSPQAPFGGGYPMQQQPPVQYGAFPPPPPQGTYPPQGGSPYGR